MEGQSYESLGGLMGKVTPQKSIRARRNVPAVAFLQCIPGGEQPVGMWW